MKIVKRIFVGAHASDVSIDSICPFRQGVTGPSSYIHCGDWCPHFDYHDGKKMAMSDGGLKDCDYFVTISCSGVPIVLIIQV